MTLTVYNFEIFYKLKKTNFANESLRRLNYKETLTLNIKLLSSLQSKLALSKNMRNFSKIFDDVFEIINVQKLEFALNAKNLKKMFESASMKLNVQKLASSLSAKNLKEIFENVLIKLSAQKFKFSMNI